MLENIKLNEKYTMIVENDLGMLVSRQIRVNEATEVKNPKYTYGDDKALRLIYTEKGKRKKRGTLFTENKIALIEGWKEVSGVINGNDKSFEMVSFDEGAFENVLINNNLSPIVKYNC